MPIATGSYKGWILRAAEPYEGMAVFFVTAPGPDPRCWWGVRTTMENAIVAGRQLLLQEAKNERIPRSRS